MGYEALYWVPFLAWAADQYGVRPERIVALSRGGTDLWYRGIAGRYIEIFDLVEPTEFAKQAAARRERGDQKQMALSEFDRELIRLASGRLGVRDCGGLASRPHVSPVPGVLVRRPVARFSAAAHGLPVACAQSPLPPTRCCLMNTWR